jgi:hypothetical protein
VNTLLSLIKSYLSVFGKVSQSRTPGCLTMDRLIESYFPFTKHLPITLSGYQAFCTLDHQD